jgi:hypothetical protein
LRRTKENENRKSISKRKDPSKWFSIKIITGSFVSGQISGGQPQESV